MNCLRELTVTLSPFCRSALPVGLSLLCQSTVLLLLGLLLGKGLSRRGPTVQTWVYRTTLVGTVLSACLCILLAGRFQAVWHLALPQAPSTEAFESTPLPLHSPIDAPVLPGTQRTRLGGLRPSVLADAKTSAALVRSLGYPITIEVPSVGRKAELRIVSKRPLQSLGAQRLRDGSFIGPDWNRIPLLYTVPMAVWGGGILVGLLWLVLCQLSLRHIQRGCVPITAGNAPEILRVLCAERMRPPQLLAGARVPSPFLAGLWRPAILLPTSYRADFDGSTLRAILTHELAHLARRDCAWNLLARLVCIVGWVQPLLWMLCRRLEQAGEEACDQIVLETGCAPEAYARCLLVLAERLRKGYRVHAVGVGAVAFRSSLGQRVQRILNYPFQPALPLSPRLHAALLVGLLILAAVCPALVSAKVETPPAIPKLAPPLIPAWPVPAKLPPPVLPLVTSTAAIASSSIRPASALTVHPHQPQTAGKKATHPAASPTSVERQIKAMKAEFAVLLKTRDEYMKAARQLTMAQNFVSELEANLADMRTKYTDADPRIRELQARLTKRNEAVTLYDREKGRWLQLYLDGSTQLRTELKKQRAGDTLAFRETRDGLLENVRLLDREMTMAQMDAATPKEHGGPGPVPAIKISALRVTFGMKWHNEEHDRLDYRYMASGPPNQCLKMCIEMVIEYYDADGKLLSTITVPYEEVIGAIPNYAVASTFTGTDLYSLDSHYFKPKAPSGAVKVRYHYVVLGEIKDGAVVCDSDSRASDAREVDLQKQP